MPWLLCLLGSLSMALGGSGKRELADGNVPEMLRSSFAPPAQFADDFGSYRSPLKFDDGTSVKTVEDWRKRREEILTTWRNLLGEWPPLIEKPQIRYLEQTHRDNFTQHKVTIEIAPNNQTVPGYLLIPSSVVRPPPSGGPRGVLRCRGRRGTGPGAARFRSATGPAGLPGPVDRDA